MADIDELQSHVPPKFLKQYEEAIGVIVAAKRPVRVISHYDADGLCAAGAMCTALYRAGIDFHLSISRALDEKRLRELKAEGNDLIAFCDMGSGQVGMIEEHLEGSTVVVLDHHRPLRESSKVFQVNPHFAGLDGTTDVSASTVLFLFAIGLSRNNWDQYILALAGSIGDKQHIGGLKGLNRKLLDAAVKKGLVRVSKELILNSEPLLDALTDSLEPYFVGLSGRRDAVQKLLAHAGIDGSLRVGELSPDIRRELVSILALRVLSQGARREIAEGLVAEQFWFESKKIDAREFSSYVNACGRLGREDVGIAYCMGDLEAPVEAVKIRKEYRASVRDGLLTLEKEGTKSGRNIQYIYSPDPSIAGSHAGIGMMYFFDQEKPVIAISRVEGEARISTRGTAYLVEKGLDLALACRTAAGEVGGSGGGHNIAAGATIPLEKEGEFLGRIDELVGKQMESVGKSSR